MHSIDPDYYTSNEDGSESHGYWIKTADWERKEQLYREASKAVKTGVACWLIDAPDYQPF